MLKAQIKEILAREFSDTFRIEKLASDLEKLFIDELGDCLVSILLKLQEDTEDEQGSVKPSG